MSERTIGGREAAETSQSGRDAPLIFDRPDLQEKRQRWLHWALTLVAWVIWAYLWLPVLTLVAWYLGFRTFVREIVLPDPATMVSTGLTYLGIVSLIALLLIGWSRYNLGRFGGADRRRAPPRVTDPEVQRYFEVDPDTFQLLRTGASVTVQHDEEGRVRDAAPRRVSQAPEAIPGPGEAVTPGFQRG